MLNMFAAQINLEFIDELLVEFRDFNPELSESAACKIKFSNSSLGVAAETQQKIERLVFTINNNRFPKVDEASLLKVIDLLTLYANHLDQQTSDNENKKL